MLRARRDTESQEGYLTIWKILGAKRNAGFEKRCWQLEEITKELEERYLVLEEIRGTKEDTGIMKRYKELKETNCELGEILGTRRDTGR